MITQLYRYPIKGLSAEPLEAMPLVKDEGLAGDRVIAIARKPGVFDPAQPKAQPKHKFLMLMRDEALALLKTAYDPATQRLTVRQDQKTLLDASLTTQADKVAVQKFFADYLSAKGLDPHIVQAPGHKFTDISTSSPQKMRAISLINLASLRALEDAIGARVDPLRFRANIYFDGPSAWCEHDWIGQEILIGSVRARVIMRTQRCAATQVNPQTGERDINVPSLLQQHFGHADLGVYAQVLSSGTVQSGDVIGGSELPL